MRNQLFINNEWRDADRGHARRDQSGDGRDNRARAVRGPGRSRWRRRGGAGGARWAVGQDVGARSRAAGLEDRREADGAGRRDRAARDAPQRQADLRVAPHRGAGRGGLLSVLCGLGRQDSRRDHSRHRELSYLHAARAGRRRGRDRAVEFPAAAGRVEGRAGARLREHRHHQAGEPDAADRSGAGGDRRRGGVAAGRAQRPDRPRIDSRRDDRRAPGIDKIAFTGETSTGRRSCAAPPSR